MSYDNSQNVVDEYINDYINSYIEDNVSMDILPAIKNELQEGASSSTTKARKKRGPDIDRGREEGHLRIWNDYFSDNPVYTDDQFRPKRFRMRRELFLRIVNALENHYTYFQQRVDAVGRSGLSPIQKCTAAMRMLAYGISGDAVDDYVRIASNTAIECLKKFTLGVIEIFGEHYLRRPTTEDIQRLLQISESRGFPGMLGSIDCMHWKWEKCPVAWQGMYTRGDQGKPTMILEAVASYDLWIWHAYFGVAGSNNDINVLDRSSVFNDFLEGRGPEVQFKVNDSVYNMGYYLADGIYPEWPVFVKTIPQADLLSEKRKLFARLQEGARKDIERAFGVLQKRFAIVSNPARLWDKTEVGDVMQACIILHNMIIKDERDDTNLPRDVQYDIGMNQKEGPEVLHGILPNYYANRERYFENHRRLRNRGRHHQLQHDLVEHLWQRFGGDVN